MIYVRVNISTAVIAVMSYKRISRIAGIMSKLDKIYKSKNNSSIINDK